MNTNKIDELLKQKTLKELQEEAESIMQIFIRLNSKYNKHEKYVVPRKPLGDLRGDDFHYGKRPEANPFKMDNKDLRNIINFIVTETYFDNALEAKTKSLLDKLDLTNV
jgi:hypothetical protein